MGSLAKGMTYHPKMGAVTVMLPIYFFISSTANPRVIYSLSNGSNLRWPWMGVFKGHLSIASFFK